MTVLAASGSPAAANPWVVAAIVVVPTFMEVLDTTIAVVALRYIAGGLSATVDDGEWVLTSYLAANAIILPITGWLSAHLGRRNYFLLSIGVFTLASGLCGHSHQPQPADLFPRDPRPGRRRPSAFQPGRAARCLSPRKAGHGDDAVRPGGPVGARRRPDARRLDHRPVFLALGVPDQRPGRPAGLCCLLSQASRSGLSRHCAPGVAQATVQLRLGWPVAAGDRHGLLGGDAQQGTGMGLAGRSLLARADAGDSLRRGPGRA